MLEDLRKFFQSRGGFIVAGMVGLVGIVAVVYAFKANFGTTDAERFTSDRTFIDASTGKPFSYTIKIGDTLPITAPSGQKTGWPAELCYWNKDGSIRKTPFPVLLNVYKNPGSREPTFCPDCGRLVVPHNPAPVEGSKPPPTQEEYKSHTSPGR